MIEFFSAFSDQSTLQKTDNEAYYSQGSEFFLYVISEINHQYKNGKTHAEEYGKRNIFRKRSPYFKPLCDDDPVDGFVTSAEEIVDQDLIQK